MWWGVCATLLLFLPLGCARPPLLPGVNLILITIDTLRADRLATYGYPGALTPNMDRLARQGVFFPEMVASVPLTLPSHTSFLTGLSPSRHGVHDNGAYSLDPERITLAERLSAGGYRTAAIVSSFQLDKKYGLDQGFDEYDDTMPDLFTIYDQRIARGPRGSQISRNADQRRANEVNARVRAWLAQGGSEPFFLWLHYFDPHETYDPPPPYDGLFPERSWPDRQYDGEVAFLDRAIGELEWMLREKGLWERTLIVLSADHGEGLGQHREMYHDTFLYESTLRIPLIIGGGALPPAWPRLVESPARSVDVFPTLLELTGLPGAEETQGKSLVPLLLGEERNRKLVNYVETYSPGHHAASRLFGVQDGDWKYIEAPKPELYNLAADPGETENLFMLERSRAREMQDFVDEWKPSEEREEEEIDEETRERLEAIGYIQRDGPADASATETEEDPKDLVPCIDGLHRAMAYYTYGELDSSLEVLYELAEICPGRQRIYDNIGNLLITTGRYADAVDFFVSLLERAPAYAKGYFWIGMAYRRGGENREAVHWFLRGLEKDGRMQDAAYNLGLTLRDLGLTREAIGAFQGAVSVAPGTRIGKMAAGALDELRRAAAENGETAEPR
ncbi:MAG: sulfatase-like hydrolase/transferase [Candidatus Eisenbacteria bacterium]|nr:sulfatase-like hydrolase/transferase [Candidatus Eisenbacteria bacterium]